MVHKKSGETTRTTKAGHVTDKQGSSGKKKKEKKRTQKMENRKEGSVSNEYGKLDFWAVLGLASGQGTAFGLG